VLDLVDVEVALSELQIVTLKHADAQELAQLLAQLFAGGRLGGVPGAPTLPAPPSLAPVPAPGPASPPGLAPPAGLAAPAPGAAASADRPLIVPERRSNSLVIHARRQEMETIRRLIEKLDVDLYGGQRVFIHFAENTKARDLATTLDAIYGRGDRGPAITGTQQLPPGAASISGLTGSHPSRLTAATLPPPLLPPPGPILPAVARPAGGPVAFPGLAGEGVPVGADIRFVADEVSNAIIVTTYPRLWKEIEDTARKLDKMPRQVLIEVLAAEVTLTDDTKLGVEWAVRSGRFDVSSSPSGTLPGRPARSLIPLGGAVPVGFNLFTFAADKFLAALNALASENRVNVLSNPSIMTAENRKAVINVSTSVPIVTSQQVPVAAGGFTGNSITQTVEYRDAGIILTVTPRIGEQGTVALDVKQEVNEVGENEPPPINSPRFTKREAETSVVLLNNQTLVLGGLIQNKRTRIRTGIPLLSRIPILGYLFGSVEHKIEKTELLLLITPRTVGTALDAARITDERRRGASELEHAIPPAPRPLPTR
jgi:general secretion pathway protein D